MDLRRDATPARKWIQGRLQRPLVQFPFATFEKRIARRTPAVFDFDDAIFLGRLDAAKVRRIIAAVSHGIPFLYLCSGGLINQAEAGLCVAANSTIRTGKDFEGKIVASPSISDINTEPASH